MADTSGSERALSDGDSGSASSSATAAALDTLTAREHGGSAGPPDTPSAEDVLHALQAALVSGGTDAVQRLCLQLHSNLVAAQRSAATAHSEAEAKNMLCRNLQAEVRQLNHQLGERDYDNSMLKDSWLREKVELLKEIQLLEVELANTRIQQEQMVSFIRTHRLDQLPDLQQALGDAQQQLQREHSDRALFEDQLLRVKEQMASALKHYMGEWDRYSAKVASQAEEIEGLKDTIQVLQYQSKLNGLPTALPAGLPRVAMHPPARTAPPVAPNAAAAAMLALNCLGMTELPPGFGTGRLMCYHCKKCDHNWSKCEQLSTLPEEAKQHLIEQYKKLTDAEKKLEKERKRQQRSGRYY